MISTLTFAVLLIITILFAVATTMWVWQNNDNAPSLLFGIGLGLLILLIGFFVALGGRAFTQSMDPVDTHTIAVTVTAVPR